MDENKNKLQNIIKYGAIGVWVILIIIILINKNKITVDMILNYTPSNVLLAIIVVLMLFALKTLSIVFFSGILYTASVLIFDLPLALLVNALGAMVMITEGYFMGKTFGSNLVGTVAEKYPKLKPILHLEDQRPFLFAFLLRMMKIINFDIGSMYMGASGAKYPPYALASFLTVIPDLVLYSVLGKGISDLNSTIALAAVILYVCITIASLLVVAYLVKHPEKYE